MLPERFFSRYIHSLRAEDFVCFFSSLCFGVFAHLYKLVNWLPNWDSFVFRYDSQNMTSLGRCFLSFACGISSYYDLPWLNGLLSLLYIALAAMCICRMYSLHSAITAVLLGGLLVAFPTVTSTLTYCYVADGYFLAFLCVCLASLLLTEGEKKDFFIAVALLTFALGIYQAYITVAIMLLLLKLVDGLLFQHESAAVSLGKALRYLCCGILSGIMYLFALKIALTVTHTGLSDYQGIAGSMSLTTAGDVILHLLRAVKQCVFRFGKFFFDYRNGITVHLIFSAIMLFLLTVWLFCAMLHTHIYRTPARLVLLLFYLCCMPFGAAALYFINPSVDYHNLMTMGYTGFYLLFLLLYDHCNDISIRFTLCKNWSIFILSAAILFNFIVIANISYHKLQIAYNRSYGIAIRMADRIEQTGNALSCTKLAVLGVLPGSEKWYADVSLNMTGVTDGLLLRPDDYVVNQSVITSVLNDYCYLDYDFASHDERQRLAALEEVKQMPCWPESGSIAVVDGYVVLKLSEGAGLYD